MNDLRAAAPGVSGDAIPAGSAAGERQLLFCTGTHKTGSTALHRFLAANRMTLYERGIQYLMSDQQVSFEGNGQRLFDVVSMQRLPPATLDAMLEDHLSERACGICLSEDLTNLGRQEWDRIAAACDRRAIRPRFLTFVRDVVPYYVSLHSEFAKAGLTAEPLEAFCAANQYFGVRMSLQAIADTFGTSAMNVFSYEAHQSSIEMPLVQLLGLGDAPLDRATLAERSNRRLVGHELDVMLRLNAATYGQFARELTQLFLDEQPDLRDRGTPSPQLIEALRSRHADEILWINGTFLHQRATISVYREVLAASEEVVTDWQANADIDAKAVGMCVNQLGRSFQRGVDFAVSRMQSIDWENSTDPLVPPEFDPVAYLIFNPDVLQSQELPFAHFIRRGHAELRRISW